MLGTVTPESKAAEPRGCCGFRGNFGIQSCLLGVHRVGADDLLRCPFFQRATLLACDPPVKCPAQQTQEGLGASISACVCMVRTCSEESHVCA